MQIFTDDNQSQNAGALRNADFAFANGDSLAETMPLPTIVGLSLDDGCKLKRERGHEMVLPQRWSRRS